VPTTISALLVILFAVLPGVPGNSIFGRIVGKDNKEKQWASVVRMVGFSIAGLILYLLVGGLFNAPLPDYIVPATFDNFKLERGFLLAMALAYTGHFVGSMIASLGSAGIVLLLNTLSRATDYADTWDKFVAECIPGHWVIVGLDNGQIYSGILHRADTRVPEKERDIILREPALYMKEENNYIATANQYLFLPGSAIASIAVPSNQTDTRLIAIGEKVFPPAFHKKE
jgi:hypothetical protein